MSKTLGNILKFSFSLGLGLLILWITLRQLSEADKQVVLDSFAKANYMWLLAGAVLGFIGNVIRAERWKMMLNAVGANPHRSNVNYSVNVMNAANMIFPRLGEVMRCTLLYKTDQIPVDKSIGTMVLERIVDVVCLLITGLLAVALDYDLAIRFFKANILPQIQAQSQSTTLSYDLAIGAAVSGAILLIVLGWLGYRYRNHHLIARVWLFAKGMIDGLLSIRNLDKPLLFITYSVLIWASYVYSLYVCYFALAETHSLSLVSSLSIAFFGGIAFIISQGGIGAYPAAVGLVLLLYGVSYEVGFALGWLVWVVQTVLVVICGVISFVLVSRNFTDTRLAQEV